MLNRFATWYRDLEAEQLRVLDNPDEVLHQKPGLRRTLNCKLAELSQVERMQLREFAFKFRGWRSTAALIAWFAAFTLFGLILYLVKPQTGMLKPIIMMELLGLAVLFIFTTAWFNYRRMADNQLRFFGIIFLLASLGGISGFMHASFERGESFVMVFQNGYPKLAMVMVIVTMFIAVPMSVIGALRNRQYQMITAQLAADADKQRMERELSEARLRMLSAQIEPHFLFNTLGAVQQLAEQGAPRAAELTANLIAFLRASLSEMRSEKVTLSSDFAMVDAYLKVMQVRQGARLTYSLELPAELASQAVPSMMLLTLVENAIKHGIEPSLRGGHITVKASQEQGVLKLLVHDTGSGMSVTPGKGEGLDNIQKRLQLSYGAAAALRLEDADSGGLMAEIAISLLT